MEARVADGVELLAIFDAFGTTLTYRGLPMQRITVDNSRYRK